MAPNGEGSDWGTNRKLTIISTPCAGYRTDKAPAEAETTVSPNCASQSTKEPQYTSTKGRSTSNLQNQHRDQ